MKKLLFTIFINVCFLFVNAQQIDVPRINLMPDKPSPYLMRNWKQVAVDYDNFVFNTTKTGTNLPLTNINPASGINYSDVQHIRMDTYVGQNNHGQVAEAINIIPAVVGASLVGIDKTNHLQTNWVRKIKDFFNLKNGQNVYLNGYSSNTGHDWWYELMPNVFFYQLYALYPDVDPDFAGQFVTIADRQLEVLFKLGAKLQPWTAPSMNYRAFNLLTGLPNASSVPEPESAGSIAWILYQAYVETKDIKYLQGAELALDFLQNWNQNPSYEIQLPYGIAAAARMNAVEGTNYNIDKMLNWAFSSGIGTLRGWGAIVGKWNGYDVAGLIGEANDGGNDYAFIMNGFQHAAALAPVAKYDKRYARAIGKWILNVANASRLFYPNGLPDANQHPAGNSWAKQYDPTFCIPFEAMKQVANGKSPYAVGDAVKGGWATTDLSLYSGSSVGYLASVISKTNVEGILQIDLNKTDFRGENTYPTYLYYNPESTAQTVEITLPAGTYDLYDAISESVLRTNVSGTVSFSINAKAARILVIIPPAQSKQTVGRIRKIYGGGVMDYHYGYNYTNPLRIKAFTSDVTRTVSPGIVTFNCMVENNTGTATFKWYQNEVLISGANRSTLNWTAPVTSGTYTIRCEVSADYKTVQSPVINIIVAPEGEVPPEINNLTLSGTAPYAASGTITAEASVSPASANFDWSCSGGTLLNRETLSPAWQLPDVPGIYTLTLTVSNLLGTVTKTQQILVKDMQAEYISEGLVAYYPFNGDTNNAAQDRFHGVSHGAVMAPDQPGYADHAYAFSNSSQYVSIPSDAGLNFTDKLAVSLWIKPDELPAYEQFVISHGSYEERYKMSITPERKMRWTLKTSNGIVDVDDNTALQTGTFVHYAGQYTGYSLELYRNGHLIAWKPLSGTIGTSSKSITLARKDESETNYNFRGTIDEVRIYNAELPLKYIEKIPAMWDLASGINNPGYVESISVYPNPFQSSFTIRFDEKESSYSLVIFNLQGQKLFHQQNLHSGDVITPDKGLPSGMYLLQITSVTGKKVMGILLKKN